MKSAITIGGTTIQPGSKDRGILSVPDIFSDGSPVEIPFVTVNGARPGPTLHLQPGQHGEEMQGLEAIRRVITELNPQKLSGVVSYCLPNPIAFRQRRHFLVFGQIVTGMARAVNIARAWPGKPDGEVIERMVYAIFTNMIKGKADCVMDFHTGDGLAANPSWVSYSAGTSEAHRKTEELAKVFGTEYLGRRGYTGKTVRDQAIAHGIPTFAPEGGILGREGLPRFGFDEISVGVCVKGIRNVMKHMGMLEGRVELPPKQIIWIDSGDALGPWGQRDVLANKGGFFIPSVKPCDIVKEGDVLGKIYSPRTLGEVETATAPADGLVWGMSGYPLVNAHEHLMSIREIIEVIENQ